MKINKIFLLLSLLLQGFFCLASNKENFNSLGFLPIHQAVWDNDLAKVETLLKIESNLNIKNQEEKTPLHLAVKCERTKIIDYLLQKKANLNEQDAQGKTALHHATKLESSNVLGKLLINEANRFLKDKEGRTALHYASQRNKIFHISALLSLLEEEDKKIYITAQDNQKNTALHLATWTRSYQAIHILLKNGINAKIKDRTGRKAWSLIPKEERLESYKDKELKVIFDDFRWASHSSLENFIYKKIREKRRYHLHESH